MLVALERELTQDTELHCMGGFVLAEYYGLVRPKLGRPEREDLTLRLWIEIIEEIRGGA
jgi:hypothetical protein